MIMTMTTRLLLLVLCVLYLLRISCLLVTALNVSRPVGSFFQNFRQVDRLRSCQFFFRDDPRNFLLLLTLVFLRTVFGQNQIIFTESFYGNAKFALQFFTSRCQKEHLLFLTSFARLKNTKHFSIPQDF